MIHPRAEVSSEAIIGRDSRVWEHARIREGARIGDECVVGRGAYVDAGVHIGDRVKIQNSALIYHGVTVSSGVFIGPAAVLTNDRNPRSVMVDGSLAGAEDWLVSEITLREGCSIGASATVVAGCDVGRFAMVGAGAVVTHTVPDYAVVAGNPARLLGWACECGRRLVDDADGPTGPTHVGPAHCPMHGGNFEVTDGRCSKAVPA